MKRIAMVDIDGVMLDKNYQSTTNVKAEVAELLAKGFSVVPNSDTPIHRIRRIINEHLSFDPEIVIGENGAVVMIQDDVYYTADIPS